MRLIAQPNKAYLSGNPGEAMSIIFIRISIGPMA
jgi:hypothetical protein